MEQLKITKSPPIDQSQMMVSGSKNAALPILAAAAMIEKGQSTLTHLANISDVDSMICALKHLGHSVQKQHEQVIIDHQAIKEPKVPVAIAKLTRASLLFLGGLLARKGHCKVAYPGGCKIGKRPIIEHLNGLAALGAEINMEKESIHARIKNGKDQLTGNKIVMNCRSVGATQNLILAACSAKGESIIINGAKEPEVCDMIAYLNRCGASIERSGPEGDIHIQGQTSLTGQPYKIMPDRIEIGTYLIACCARGGRLTIEHIDHRHQLALLKALEQAGASINTTPSSIELIMSKRAKAQHIITSPYPGFPTDLQQIWCTLAAVSEGESIIEERLFEHRNGHIAALVKMGASITQKSSGHFLIQGVEKLKGTQVDATDLRASAALIIAGSIAEGHTIIDNAELVHRGYSDIDKKLDQLNIHHRFYSKEEIRA